MVDFVTIL